MEDVKKKDIVITYAQIITMPFKKTMTRIARVLIKINIFYYAYKLINGAILKILYCNWTFFVFDCTEW